MRRETRRELFREQDRKRDLQFIVFGVALVVFADTARRVRGLVRTRVFRGPVRPPEPLAFLLGLAAPASKGRSLP